MYSGRLASLEVPAEGVAGTLDQQGQVAGLKFPLVDRSVHQCATHVVPKLMKISQDGISLHDETSPRKSSSVESN